MRPRPCRGVAAACATLLLLGGCAVGPREPAEPSGVIARGPVPAYAPIAAAYNARVGGLDRLRAAVSLVIRAPGTEGKQIREQVEGNLQLALPDRLALRIDKVSQTLFYLGSNEALYWWMDLTDRPTAMVGRHDAARPGAVAEFGLPVHPLDLLELLAVRPLPVAGDATEPALAWSADGRWVVVTSPARWNGVRRLYLDPLTYDPARVEIADGTGRVAVAADLSRYQTVDVREGPRGASPPRVAGRFDIQIPGSEALAVLLVNDPQNPGSRQKAAAFDLPTLQRAYGIERVIDLDAAPDEGSASTPERPS